MEVTDAREAARAITIQFPYGFTSQTPVAQTALQACKRTTKQKSVLSLKKQEKKRAVLQTKQCHTQERES
jgi:hypothetical protein